MASLKVIIVTTLVMLVAFVPVTAVVTTNARPGLMRHEKDQSETVPEVEALAKWTPAGGEEEVEADGIDEKHYHALIFALPQVLSNLTNYSGLIGQPNSLHIGMSHKFGDIDSDKTMLLENVHGFVSLMQDILGEDVTCPSNSVQAINDCLGASICLMQSGVKNQEHLQKYALFEEMHSRFSDIGWATIASKLLENSAKNVDEYATPAQHSCNRATSWDKHSSLLETEESSTRAAAYQTSSVLVATAKSTHVILDAHAHNSSVKATIAALHEAWAPACELLNCDSTNYVDMWQSSHAHSLSLIEAGASAQHMQVHIRTRQKLELRMQRFLGEHGQHFYEHMHREDARSNFNAAPKQYFSRSRGALMQFVTSYPKTHDIDINEYPLRSIATPKMDEHFEAKGKAHVLQYLKAGAEHTDADEDDSLVEDEMEEEDDAVTMGTDRSILNRRTQGADESSLQWGAKEQKSTSKSIGKGISKGVKVISSGKTWSKLGKAGINGVDKIGKDWGKGISSRAKQLSAELKDAGNGISKNVKNVGDRLNKMAKDKVGYGFEQLGNDILWVADGIGKFAEDVIEWIESLFECFGMFSSSFAVGYGKKYPNKLAQWGLGLSASVSSSGVVDQLKDLFTGRLPGEQAIQNVVTIGKSDGRRRTRRFNKRCVKKSVSFCEPDAGNKGKRVNSHSGNDAFEITVEGNEVCARRTDSGYGWGMDLKVGCLGWMGYLQVGLSLVFGAVPGTAETGGLRTGVGINGGVQCTAKTCSVKISVGAVGSALIPCAGASPACVLGPVLAIFGDLYGCFYSFSVVVTALCCELDMLTGTNNCR